MCSSYFDYILELLGLCINGIMKFLKARQKSTSYFNSHCNMHSCGICVIGTLYIKYDSSKLRDINKIICLKNLAFVHMIIRVYWFLASQSTTHNFYCPVTYDLIHIHI